MKITRVVVLALALLLAAPAMFADDVPLAVGGGWTSFCWITDGTLAFSGVAGCGPEPQSPDAWVFAASDPTILRITDGWIAGDHFEVFDFGVSLGVTSLGANPLIDGSFFSAEYARADLEHFTTTLAAGSHSITIQNLTGCCGGGAGGIRVDAVPEPATWLLLGSTLLGLLGVRRVTRK